MECVGGMSFTSAAISAIRANQTQHPTSKHVPRATYTSSYSRDYADAQAYAEWLKTHADSNASQRASAKKALRQERESTNNQSNNNYNILSHVRDPKDERPTTRAYTGEDGTPKKSAVYPRAPYAQDEFDQPTTTTKKTNNKNQHTPTTSRDREYDATNSPTYSNPSRYITNARESYIPPDESNISSKLPPPPSKSTSLSFREEESAWRGSHANDVDDVGVLDSPSSATRRPPPATTAAGGIAAPSKSIPTLALNRVPKAAFEPYAVIDPEPTITRVAQKAQHAAEEARADAEAEDAEWRWQNMQRTRQQAREDAMEIERQQRYNSNSYGNEYADDRSGGVSAPRDSYNNSYGYERDTTFDNDREEWRATPQIEPQSHSRQQSQSHQQSYHQRQSSNRYENDEADEVSQPMGNMNLHSKPASRSAYHRDDDRSEDDHRSRHNGGGGGDRYRQQYQDGADDYDRPQPSSRSRDHHDDRPSIPSSSSSSSLRRPPSTPGYDVAAGRSSGVTDQMRAHAHQPIFGPSEPEKERPRIRRVPGYEEYVERSSRQPTRRVGPVAYDADAAGARPNTTKNEYGHLDSGWSIGDSRPAPPERRGTSHKANIQESIYDRNPILQDSSRYDPRPGSFQQGQKVGSTDSSHYNGGGGGGGSSSRSRENWSSETAPRQRLEGAMHPSFESNDIEQMRQGRTDLQPTGARRDVRPGYQSDRGLKMVGNASYAHSNIFGNFGQDPTPSSQREARSGGVRVTQDRNASHDILGGRDQEFRSEWSERSRDARTAAVAAAENRSYLQGGGGDASNSTPYSQRSSTLESNPPARTFRSPEHQAERDTYERQLRQLHQEQQIQSARGVDYRKQGRGYESTRLW